MAITFHQDYFRNSAGVKWQIIGKFDLDSSYPAGGYFIDPVQLGLSQIDSVVVNDASFGFEYHWDKVNSKLLVYESAGGGGIFTGTPAILTGTITAPTFNGTPLAPTGTNAPSAVTGTADPQTWTGNLMGTHSHNLQKTTDTGTYTAWRLYHGAVVGGPFVIGDVITDTVNTATVSGVGVGYLDLSAHSGFIQNDSAFSAPAGSGASSTATSEFLGVFTPASTPYFLCEGAGTPFVALTADAFPLNAIPNGIVPQAFYQMRYNVSLNQIEATIGTVDGTLNDSYSISYIAQDVTAVSAGTPTGANLASAINGTAAAQGWTGDPYTPTGTVTAPTLAMDPYTPAGTIAGGTSGPQVEVAGGTNLSTVIDVEFISFGL